MDSVRDDKNFKNSKLADACFKEWDAFVKTIKDIKQLNSIKAKDKKEEFFKPFIDSYANAHQIYYDKTLDESIKKLI